MDKAELTEILSAVGQQVSTMGDRIENALAEVQAMPDSQPVNENQVRARVLRELAEQYESMETGESPLDGRFPLDESGADYALVEDPDLARDIFLQVRDEENGKGEEEADGNRIRKYRQHLNSLQ